MIELEKISRIYGNASQSVKALENVDLTFQEGAYVAVMGASGSGKSTLLNIIGCLDRPTDGRYTLQGREVSGLEDDELSRVRSEVLGFVFQQFHLLSRLNAQKNVLLPLIYAENYPADAEEKAAALLAEVGLGGKLTARPGELSGGQQQRVAIARALINEPSVILADEPTGNLDRDSGLEILQIFKKLHQAGRTLIMVTHNPEVASEADRVIRIEDGRIVSDQDDVGTVEDGS